MWRSETLLQQINYFGTGKYFDQNEQLVISQEEDETPMTNNEYRSILRQLFKHKLQDKIKILYAPSMSSMGLRSGYWELCGLTNLQYINLSDNHLTRFLIPNQVVTLNLSKNPFLELVIEVQGLEADENQNLESKRETRMSPEYIFNVNDFSRMNFFKGDLQMTEELALKNDAGVFNLEVLDVTDSNQHCMKTILPYEAKEYTWLNDKGFDFFMKKFPKLFSSGKIEQNIGLKEIFEPFLLTLSAPELT